MEPHPTDIKPLSPQMLKALSGMAKGKPRAQIAREMSISPHTLKAYLSTAFMRLGAHNAPEAVAKMAELGLLKAEGEHG